MDENDPRLIATLQAVNPEAERAWSQLENQDRCSFVSESDGGVVDIPSRDTTPAAEQYGSQIQLTFDKKPKNLENGFVFGSDPRKCDVLLGGWGAGFSRQHFRITFNARGEVILEDTSRKETFVDYNGEKPPGRNNFTWILFDYYENIKITLNKGVQIKLVFKIVWPENRKSCLAQYEAHRDAYLNERRNALPSLSQLGVESQQTTAVPSAQHSPRQQPIYLPEEKLGHGSFGTVHKVVDVGTGYEYAAKTFHDGNWKKEVDILKSVSHEYIVEFVDFSEEQKPLLVMEYLPLGNLACQDFVTEEETLKILCQGLHALKYLHSHSPPLVHRDIKPENILVQSRIPFVIKLVDFGLAKNDFILKTFCGSNEYAAPEIWERHHYTAMVDIWSLGVVVLEYGYGLPRPSQKRKGKLWCRDIVKVTEDMEGEGDALIDLISTKMLRMDYRHRQSASDCLGEVYRLGFHAIQTVKIGRTTPTGKTSGQDGVTRTKSVITQPRQNAPSDSDVSSGFYNIRGASETTEVTPSKRDLREGVHFYNSAAPRSLGQHPQGPTQVRNPRTEDKATSTLIKRRRPQTTQSPTADAWGRGQSKRSRALVSWGAGELLSEASKPRQGPKQLERSNSSNHEGPLTTDGASLTHDIKPIPQAARKPMRKRTRPPLGRSSALVTEVSPREIEKPPSKRAIQELCAWKSVQREPVEEPKLSKFIEITGSSSSVMVRRSDFRVNAAHIIKIAGRSRGIGMDLRDRLDTKDYDLVRGRKNQGTYVNLNIGIELCREYGLLELEKRLHSLKHASEGPVLQAEPSHVEPRGQIFRRLPESPGSDTVSVRNESTRSRKIWNRYLPPTSSGGPITEGPMQAEDTHEMESSSDVAGSGGSVTSRESHSIQQKPRPVPSIRFAKDAPSSHQSGHDTRHSLLADSAKDVQYNVWDSRPQLSALTEVEPELRPSTWKTASHYGSFSDLFAPI